VDAQEPKAAHPPQERLKPQPVGLQTVAYAFLPRPLEPAVAQEFRMVVALALP
jgi:hypothetical protein